MDHLPFKCITIVINIFIQSVWQTKCQYTQIWYDDMQKNNGWTSSGQVEFGYDSKSCTSSRCTQTVYEGSSGLAWIRRETGVSQYSSLQLQYDVSTRSLDDNDECRVYYSYIGSSLSVRIKIHGVDPSSQDRLSYPNQEVILPDASTANTVWIWLETYSTGSSEDTCYWDDVYLNGILLTTTPQTPTKNPTSHVSPTQTQHTKSLLTTTAQTPTKNPTKLPTSDKSTIHDGSTVSTQTQHTESLLTTTAQIPTKHRTKLPTSDKPTIHDETTVSPTQTPAFIYTLHTESEEELIPNNLSKHRTLVVGFLVMSGCCCVVLIAAWCCYAFCIEKQEEPISKIQNPLVKRLPSTSNVQAISADDNDTFSVSSWLTDTVRLPQYLDIFIQNGYDTSPILLVIDREQLTEMGIDNVAHQLLLLSEIKKLKTSSEAQGEDTYLLETEAIMYLETKR